MRLIARTECPGMCPAQILLLKLDAHIGQGTLYRSDWCRIYYFGFLACLCSLSGLESCAYEWCAGVENLPGQPDPRQLEGTHTVLSCLAEKFFQPIHGLQLLIAVGVFEGVLLLDPRWLLFCFQRLPKCLFWHSRLHMLTTFFLFQENMVHPQRFMVDVHRIWHRDDVDTMNVSDNRV